MERVQVLIDKLSTQKASNEAPAQMLVTVQLLHQELQRIQMPPATLGSTKVAVVLPSVFYKDPGSHTEAFIEKEVAEKPEVKPVPPVSEVKEEKPFFQQQSFFEPVQEEVKPAPAIQEVQPDSYTLKKPSVYAPEPIKEEVKPVPPASTSYNVMEEIPTLSYRQPQRELHEVIGAQEASLNDKLKEEKAELAHVLKDAPIKDLRKGIGVNDKFLFINELFGGDESLYERSIKTINAFHILPEAEYWINRELKMRLAWNDNKETVQYFYQLVRRRFS